MRKDNFSVALGLTDYVNPILYAVTSFTLIKNLDKIMNSPYSVFYILGVILSLIFGFAIPTLKLLIGLGKMEFKLPVMLVFLVNLGIFVSGLMLIKNILSISNYLFAVILLFSIIFLYLIYRKTNKFNNVAVLIGAVGYLLIYISLICKSVQLKSYVSLVLYAIAICLYVLLVGIGLKADLKDSRVHWVIEISNIVCQLSVAVGTIILFNNFWLFRK